MKAFVARDFGRITGAYWAPVNSGGGYAEAAVAALSVDGAARVFAWRDITRRSPYHPYGLVVIGREHTGSTADDIQRGKDLDPAIRGALEAAILAAMQNDQAAAAARAAHNNGPRDEWGNLIADQED